MSEGKKQARGCVAQCGCCPGREEALASFSLPNAAETVIVCSVRPLCSMNNKAKVQWASIQGKAGKAQWPDG